MSSKETKVKDKKSVAIEERFFELRETGKAIKKLAEDEKGFNRAVEAFRAQNQASFQAELERTRLTEYCRWICQWLCSKHCVFVCIKLCGPPINEQPSIAEMREFALVTARIAEDDALLKQFVDVVDREDVEQFKGLIVKNKLERFCHQLCHWLCSVRCRRVCDLMCLRPQITRIGSIPISQIDSQGFGNGPSMPPFQVPPPAPASGVGDHTFGASAELRGVFNMAAATQYLVEISSNPGGPYKPIITDVQGYNYISVFPWIQPVTRKPSGGSDPGWFNVLDSTVNRLNSFDGIPDSNGGPNAIAEKRLMDWLTTTFPDGTAGAPDGIYYLRLRVRDGGGTTLVSSPQVVQTDNTGPPTPVITLQLQKKDGTRIPLKCGGVKKGEGVIVVTVQAYDTRSFSRLGVAADGNSSLSVPIVDINAVPLSKTYNGNLADQGYPVLTEFLWDPWSDPRIIPCCYVVRIDIWDRAVLNNSWSGGHGNSGWEAIEIGF